MTKGLWDYFQSQQIAHDYDEYFRGNSLFEFDESVLERYFQRPGLVADLGCGTGRLLVPLARRGFTGLAVDLSAHMLEVVGEKAAAEQLAIHLLRANIVELGCLRDQVVDYCICMFSTLGMVRGHANRLRTLAHVRRILKPGGRFVLHVHNRWYNLYTSEGRRWLMAALVGRAVGSDVEPGDKFFSYRGIPQMYLHVFTRRELVRLLQAAGLRVIDIIPLDTRRRHRLRCAWWLGRLRANGWIVVAQRSDES